MKQKSKKILNNRILKMIISIVIFLNAIVSLIKTFSPSLINKDINDMSLELLAIVLLIYYTYNNYEYE